jgi:hypothetical protein
LQGCHLFITGPTREQHCHCELGSKLVVEGTVTTATKNSGSVQVIGDGVVECFGGKWMKKEGGEAGYARYECVLSPLPLRWCM